MKSISMKLDSIDSNILYSHVDFNIPLYSNAIRFICWPDSVVLSASRLIILNFFNSISVHKQFLDFLKKENPNILIRDILKNPNSDDIAFFNDLIQVCPDFYQKPLIESYNEKLLQSDIRFLALSISFLINTSIKSTIMKRISYFLFNFDFNDNLYFAVLLYSLEHNLILFDTALSLGLITNPPSFSFIDNYHPNEELSDFIIGMGEILKIHKNLFCFASVLRIFEKIFKEPPPFINEALIIIITILKTSSSNTVIKNLIIPGCYQRTDIEYALNQESNERIDRERLLILMLYEMESSKKRWEKQNGAWFSLNDCFSGLPNVDNTFPINSKNVVEIKDTNIIINGQIISIDNFFIASINDAKMIYGKGVSGPTSRSVKIVKDEIEFSSRNQLRDFADAVALLQNTIINSFLNSILKTVQLSD